MILRVHQSNFRTVGFVEDVGIEALCELGVPTIDDLGSGVLLGGLDELLADEPPVRASVAAGAALVCFSGDKLLGGPQAGILVGTKDAIAACRRHPLARALRVGRLPLAALAATLALYRDPARAVREIPVLAMLAADPATLARRARRLADATGGEVIEAVARAGGGALPLLELRGPAVAIAAGRGRCRRPRRPPPRPRPAADRTDRRRPRRCRSPHAPRRRRARSGCGGDQRGVTVDRAMRATASSSWAEVLPESTHAKR